ncbi:c-type cytochrome [Prosthecodimorpha staleyi]|uniref:Cytochrome c n=1 Tax=Prosthecodimorpha staleyi TaxID=2840188 RepID=A0A947GIW6_9HYPH|nr:cytochrome c [Prosthecodimorpha staleyi]MBT9290419.1 cytochrome c [Prosthecodimorpha staleyi]
MKVFAGIVGAALAVVVAGGVAFAQVDVIKQRQEAMKAVGGAMGALVKMVKGEEAYDSAKAKAAVETMAAKAKGFDALFPAGSDKGAENAAAPKIWTDMAGFKAALAKLEQVAGAQAAVAGKDLDGVKAAVGALSGTCKGCHDDFRLKKS